MLGVGTCRASHLRGILIVKAATHYMLLTRCRALGIRGSVLKLRVCILGIPVRAILHDVTQHILQSERVGLHLRRLLRTVLAVVHIDHIAVDDSRIGTEESVPEALVRELLGAALEEVRSRGAAAGRILPLGLRRQTVLLARLLRQPLAEGLGSIVGHRYGRALTHTPSLIGESERRRGAAYGIHILTRVVGIYLLGRNTSLRHGLAVEGPILIPRNLHLADEEGRYGNVALRRFVAAAERLVLGAAHGETAARYGHHLERCRRAGYRLRKVLELGHGRRLGIYLGRRVRSRRQACHLSMLIVRVVVSGIEVTAYALEVELLLVLLVVEVRRHTVVGNTLREEVDVALLARLVVDDLGGIFQLTLAVPVDILLFLGQVRPYVLHARGSLGLEVCERSLGREVALHAVGLHAAAVIVVYGLFPACIRFGMVVTHHASLVRRALDIK